MWFRFPSAFTLVEPYALSRTETLLSAGPGTISRTQLAGKQDLFTGCLIYDGGPVGSVPRLKQFIEFWWFVLNDWQPAFGFLSAEQVRMDPAPAPVVAPEHVPRLDPRAVTLSGDLSDSDTVFELADLYERFLNAEKSLSGLIVTLMHAAAPGPQDHQRVLFHSPWEAAMGALRVIDALTSSRDHDHNVRARCEKCRCDVDARHVAVSRRDRLKGLFSPFPDADDLAELARTAFNKIRNPLAHGEFRGMPCMKFPVPDPETGAAERSATLASSAKGLLDDGLEAEYAIQTLQECVRVILLNRLYPEIEFWPRFGMQMLVSVPFATPRSESSE